MRDLNQEIYSYLLQYPPALEMYDMLEKTGNIYLIGGILREYKDKGEIQKIRDIDIIIEVTVESYWQELLKKYQPTKNKFGGYKLSCSGLIVDIWELKETWAYRNKLIPCNSTDYLKKLPDTVFLNIDAIIYDLKRNIWYDEKYQQAMQSKIIDVVLEKNPQILLNIVRALVLRKQYKMSFSEKLINIIKEEEQHYSNFLDVLMYIQQERYNKKILQRKEIEEELKGFV